MKELRVTLLNVIQTFIHTHAHTHTLPEDDHIQYGRRPHLQYVH